MQLLSLETTAWYTIFFKSIIPDYDSNPNQIIYKNLDGYAVTKGISTCWFGFQQRSKMILDTYMDVNKTENNIKTRQSYRKIYGNLGNILPHKLFFRYRLHRKSYGPMRLPLLGA
jgi:outer membrane receptor for ferrienterochelin and colicins